MEDPKPKTIKSIVVVRGLREERNQRLGFPLNFAKLMQSVLGSTGSASHDPPGGGKIAPTGK